MSKHSFKQSMFNRFFNCRIEDVGQVVILSCFDRLSDFDQMMKKYQNIKINGFVSGCTYYVEDRKITYIYTGVGAMEVADIVLALGVTECQYIIYTGIVACINEDYQIGDLVIPNCVLEGDSISRFISNGLINQDFSEEILCLQDTKENEYIEKINNKRMNVRVGKCYSVGSLFSETPSFIEQLQNRNVDFLDVETYAFYLAIREIKRKGIAIHYISDFPKHEDNIELISKKSMRIYTLIPRIIIEYINMLGIS